MAAQLRNITDGVQNAKSVASPVTSDLSRTPVVSVISQANSLPPPLRHTPTTTSTPPFVVIRTLANASGTSTIVTGGNVSGGIKITPVLSHSLKVATSSPTLIRPVGSSPKTRPMMVPSTAIKPQSPAPDVKPTIKPDPTPVASSSSTPQPQRNVIREMQVRVPNRRDKRFSVLRFHTSDHPDLTSGLEVFMQRENNLKQFRSAHNIQDTPDRGAGSEFGREAKEEARLRKYGIVRESYRPDDQPWVMTVGKGKTGRRRFKGAREGSVSENVEYFVFCQCKDGNFDAYPVHAWYKMKPEINYRFLREDEAEVEYTRIHKTMNLFNVMIKRKLTDGEGADEETDGSTVNRDLGKELRYLSVATESRGTAEKESSGPRDSKSIGSRRSDRTLKLTDLEEFNSESDADAEDEEEESAADQSESVTTEVAKPGTSKQKPLSGDTNKVRPGRVKSAAERARLLRKKQRDAAIVSRMRRCVRKRRTKKGRADVSSSEEDDPLEEAQDESEVDDHEGDEVDYMTNSSSDEEKLSADEREKIYEETGVDDEAALKALLTDVSSEEEEEEGREEQAELGATEAQEEYAASGMVRKRPEGSLEAVEPGTKGYESLLLDDDLSSKLHRNKKKVHSRNEDEAGSSSSSSSSSSVDGDSSSYSSSSSDLEVDAEEKAKKSSKKAALLQKLSESIHGASGPSSTGGTVSESGDSTDLPSGIKRRLTDATDSGSGSPASISKKARLESPAGTTASSSVSCDSELMSTVRKYLMRKPITVTELLKKIRLRKLVGKNEDAQTALANVLRQLRPIKQIINGQHALSLKH